MAIGAVMLANAMMAAPAYAQLNGEHVLGDTGVGNGIQPPPGFYVAGLYYRYGTDTIRTADGSKVTIDPSQPGSMTLQAFALTVLYVSKKTLLGAHYGTMFVLPIANGGIEAPAFGLSQPISAGLADAYVVPFSLGWHTPRANFTTGFGFFAPTGRYTAGASDNIGKDMWSYELSAGTTVFLDPAKAWTLATSAYWETHTKKSDQNVSIVGKLSQTGVKVGDLLTLEGGVGRSFLGGAASVGVAYYAQWKVTADDLGIPGEPVLGKHRVYGIGPDVTVPIASKTTLIALLNVRYLLETGVRLKSQGDTFVVTTTFPIPSVKITK
jgi:hypothetical protein